MRFEIVDSENKMQIEFIKSSAVDSKSDWDRNYISTRIKIKAGTFQGDFLADIMTIEIEKFKQELKTLHDNLVGQAEFVNREKYLIIKIKGDGIGHFKADCVANDNPGIYGNQLEFNIEFDQTQINNLIN